MNDLFGIIFTGDNSPALGDLTRSRSDAALPIGGRYRIIDVLLSNLVNAGVGNVGVLCQRNYHSIMDHLGNGREWDLSRKRDGLFILPPYVSSESHGEYSGVLDALNSNINYIRRSNEKYLALIGSSTIYNVDFERILDYHIAKGADITIMSTRLRQGEPLPADQTYIEVAGDGRITDIEIAPKLPHYSAMLVNTLIVEKGLMLYLLDAALAHNRSDIMRDLLQRNITEYKIYAYEHEGYVRHISTAEDFFRMNMDLLDRDIRRELLMGERPVRTKIKDEVPAKYLGDAHAANCLLADGCIIAGTVSDSVLFRGVQVGENTRIRNSIIMQGSYISEGCELENVILDKNVFVKPGQKLMGTPAFPIIVRKNMIV